MRINYLILYDLTVHSFIVGCRYLELIDKFVTGSLWHLLESKIYILELFEGIDISEKVFEKLLTP